MFTELMPLLRKRRLLLTVSLVEGDTIRATVVPQKASDTEDNAVTTLVAITGTAEELDRGFPQQLFGILWGACSSKARRPLPKPKWMPPQKRLVMRHGRNLEASVLVPTTATGRSGCQNSCVRCVLFAQMPSKQVLTTDASPNTAA
jgi:hypothetical protein